MAVSRRCASLVGDREVQTFEIPGLWAGSFGTWAFAGGAYLVGIST